MQETGGGGGGVGGGGHELTRASGLARFRSAPATWLDALLEDDDSLKLSGPTGPAQGGGLTQLLTAGTTTAGPSSTQSLRPASSSYLSTDPSYFESGSGGGGAQTQAQAQSQSQQPTHNQSVAFQRMNSSPAEFLSANIDGYFSSFGIPSSYDFVGGSGSSGVDVSSSSGKRLRDNDSDQHSPNFSSQRRVDQSGQLSTANSLVEMEMEKLLEDSVPCRVRAKRGCATHPRSIAERVRRTRISDRIRKLQELVPNMDKQTNTADMLEEAVEYVKNLQRQIQELTEAQKNCKCIAKS
nr:hypothetical protein [Suaeda aralocaspica]